MSETASLRRNHIVAIFNRNSCLCMLYQWFYVFVFSPPGLLMLTLEIDV